MRKRQTGEVVLAIMVVMMVVGMMGMMGMGKMEEDAAHAEKSGSTKPQTKAEALPSSAPKGPAETQN